MIIAIDGPAGTGKTTVSKILAKRLNISYLDTGATYRSLTLKALDNGVDLSNKDVLIDLAKTLNLQIKGEKVYLEGVDVNFMIRTPVIDKNISLIVSYPEVRQIMVELQRKLAKTGDYVVEGRDITTVVFPQAEFKFYLDGDTAVRAQRRYNELIVKGLDVNFENVKKDLIRRDNADKNRSTGALKISEDAKIIDTTNLTVEETVDELIKNVKKNES